MFNFEKKHKERTQTINAILDELELLRKRDVGNRYALQENIKFFQSLYSPKKFMRWLLFDMSKIDRTNLLELADFDLPKWQRVLQEELLQLEKRRIPDILGFLRREILRQINQLSLSRKQLTLLNVGAGAMELERQVILQLLKTKNKTQIIFFGVDTSQAAIDAASNNLCDLPIKLELQQIEGMNPLLLSQLQEKLTDQYSVVYFKGDAFVLPSYFGEKSIDLAYHSKFKHHLPIDKKLVFDETLISLTDRIVEMDDHSGGYLIVFSLLANWYKPVLMNGAIFSSLRADSPKRLRYDVKDGWSISVKPVGGYLRVYTKKPK